ncbi:MAG: PAS domain S-box protein [Candidatus Lokiarchaeota archaeon]|nr:PAS domain S-box protein [Candidatus Lokiarchaeota archaeon]MBD3202019.1 PAS domain S-box protein [Candidatus Lokiarchaeota archaeon]
MLSNLNNLKDLKEFSSDFISLMSDWIWEIDQRRIIKKCSEEINQYLGYSTREIIGKSIKIITPTNSHGRLTLFKRMKNNKEPILNFKSQMINKSGKTIDVISNAIGIKDEAGEFKGYLGINKAISLKGKRETEYVESNVLEELLYENYNGLLFLIDINNNFRIKSINRDKPTSALGYSEQSFIENSFLKFIHDQDIPKIKKYIIKNNGTRDPLEVRIKTKKKDYLWYSLRRIHSEKKIPKHLMIVLLEDISEKKEIQKNLDDLDERFTWLSNAVPEIRYWKLLQPKNYLAAVRRSQDILEKIIDNIPQYIHWKDKDLNYLGCNKNFANLIGINNPENIFGKTNKDISLFTENWEHIETEEHQILRSGKSHFNLIESLYIENKGLRFFEINRIILSDKKGPVVGLLTTLEDITERKLAETKLKASEKKYRTILENIKESYYETDLEGNLTFFNDAFLNQSSYSKDELLGMNYSTLTGDQYKNEVYQAFNKVYSTEKGLTDLQYKGFKRNGEEIVVETSVYLRYDSNGNKIGFSGLIRNITDKYQLQKRLKQSEKQYRLISENAYDFISILNDKFQFEYINEKPHLNGMGYEREDLIGKSCLGFIHPDDLNSVKNILKEGFGSKGSGIIETRFKHKNGRWVWLEVKGRTFYENNNELKAHLISRDITDRKLTEKKLKDINKLLEQKVLERTKKLRESEKQFRTITEQSSMAILIMQDYNILYANTKFSELVGYNNNEVISWNKKEYFKLIHPEDYKRVTPVIENKYKGNINSIKNLQFRIIGKENEIIWVEVFSKTIPYKGDEADLVSLLDITEKKKTELQLIESENKLREQNIELRKLDKLKTDFITMAAHELKTPLISISGYIDLILLREGTLGDEIENELERVISNVKRLESYINKLLDTMKIDARKMDFDMEPSNVYEIINDCLSELEYQIKRKNISVNLKINKNVIVNLDKFRIKQVLTNLISNAVKFSPDNEVIRISSKIKDQKIFIKVKDNGVGLTDNEIGKLFEKFVMLGGDIEKFSKGSGLGLYISKGIIKAHGGEIWARSEGKNKGSEFFFTLPLKN